MDTSSLRVSRADAQDAFEKADVSVSDHQLERWRSRGLLPRAYQVGLGKGRGSFVEFDRVTVDQAIAIARLYQRREKRNWVGWQLWLSGFDVDDCYWRPVIDDGWQLLKRASLIARLHLLSSDIRQERNVAFLMSHLKSTPLASSLAKVAPTLLSSLFGMVADVLQGDFVGFSLENGRPNLSELDAFISALGVKAAQKHVINGSRLSPERAMEGVLHDLSATFGAIGHSKSAQEPSVEAREEFQRLVEIANSLYQAGKPKFGRSAFGLRLISRITAKEQIPLQASMLILWEQLRLNSKNLISYSEVQQLAHKIAHWPPNQIS